MDLTRVIIRVRPSASIITPAIPAPEINHAN